MASDQIKRFNWHGRYVTGIKKLVGKNREHCLCYFCKEFKPSTEENCEIAQKVYRMCCKHGLSLNVAICDKFEEKE
jgi:hypothetical protein